MNTVACVFRFLWLFLSPAWARTRTGWLRAAKYAGWFALALLAGYSTSATGVATTSRDETFQGIFWLPLQYPLIDGLWFFLAMSFLGLAILVTSVALCLLLLVFVFYVIPEMIWPASIHAYRKLLVHARTVWVQAQRRQND